MTKYRPSLCRMRERTTAGLMDGYAGRGGGETEQELARARTREGRSRLAGWTRKAMRSGRKRVGDAETCAGWNEARGEGRRGKKGEQRREHKPSKRQYETIHRKAASRVAFSSTSSISSEQGSRAREMDGAAIDAGPLGRRRSDECHRLSVIQDKRSGGRANAQVDTRDGRGQAGTGRGRCGGRRADERESRRPGQARLKSGYKQQVQVAERWRESPEVLVAVQQERAATPARDA